MLGNSDDGMNMGRTIDAMVAVALKLPHKRHWLDQPGIHGPSATTDQNINPIGEPSIEQRQERRPISTVGLEGDRDEEVVILVNAGLKPVQVLLVRKSDHLLFARQNDLLIGDPSVRRDIVAVAVIGNRTTAMRIVAPRVELDGH